MNARVYLNQDKHLLLQPGDYGRDARGVWMCRVPVSEHGLSGDLSAHEVTEHEDGTITVSPSILITMPDPDNPGANIEQWHGYLERGVWREC